MVTSSELKYKLMRHVNFNPLLFWIADFWIQNLFHVLLYDYYYYYTIIFFFIQSGTLFSRHFSLYNLLSFWALSTGWWIVKPKGSSLQRHQNCLCGTLKSAPVIILSLVRLFQLWVPNWGVLANRLKQFWRQKGVQPGTRKVFLIKWPVSVYIYILVVGRYRR